jgi:hypothetical protein
MTSFVLELVIFWRSIVLGNIFNARYVQVIPVDMRPPYGEIDVLSPIEGTYQNNNLFYFPEAYERLELL